MSLLRNAIKSSVSLRTIKPIHSLPSLLRQSPKHFSTETEAPPPPPPNDASIDLFLQTPTKGVFYGKLLGISRQTLKSDIINLLEGCNLTPDDLKVNYTRNYMPFAMMMQFPSFSAYDNAFRLIGRKGRLYRLERAEQSEWDIVMPYNGKTVLLQNVPRIAVAEDVERFLSGCEYEASSISFMLRQSLPDSIKWATVRFPSQTQAMDAFIRKNRGFCLNNQVSVRVLQ
ncbi:hypothetical protein KPL70_017562 [Citrus sinensis]|uniref:Uncharacterized protein n=2 Tax=Citrus TaxID=2706 RepID=V4S491_CITCL|nr:uncharacterized protein LOC18038899 [Citrus x clementina]XP_006480529.1 uncharacterized protein LOC102606880 isoform X1 [Citrus sinensis]ESR42198.1 hypothetical protein CICLE_v10012666mg [Citrus x clementina]KAH9672024.1 hypothetical protein KPL70_017562 [Citrus sinensis]